MLEAEATSYTHRKKLGDLILTQNEALRIERRIDSSWRQRQLHTSYTQRGSRHACETEAASYWLIECNCSVQDARGVEAERRRVFCYGCIFLWLASTFEHIYAWPILVYCVNVQVVLLMRRCLQEDYGYEIRLGVYELCQACLTAMRLCLGELRVAIFPLIRVRTLTEPSPA